MESHHFHFMLMSKFVSTNCGVTPFSLYVDVKVREHKLWSEISHTIFTLHISRGRLVQQRTLDTLHTHVCLPHLTHCTHTYASHPLHTHVYTLHTHSIYMYAVCQVYAHLTPQLCVAVCCSVLQCVAVSCSVLQCVAVCQVLAHNLLHKMTKRLCMINIGNQ